MKKSQILLVPGLQFNPFQFDFSDLLNPVGLSFVPSKRKSFTEDEKKQKILTNAEFVLQNKTGLIKQRVKEKTGSDWEPEIQIFVSGELVTSTFLSKM